ncbi:MAG: DUF1801 domain-containing protein [Caldilineaceae bacterium]|nr:DUF1801 domain-containing protein [Caldilineaceae bacterium]
MASKRRQAVGQTVDEFLAALDHPHKAESLTLRQIILAADPSISEEIKWNAPSFRTTESFATFHLRAKRGVQLVLHLGAKVRETATSGIDLADPAGLLTWLAKDRAAVTFTDHAEIHAKQNAFTALIRAWIVNV